MTFWGLRRERAACAEARDAELLGAADAGTLARVSRHLVKCAACQAERARLDALRADVRIDPAPLDDLTRARILDRLIPALDDLASGRAHALPRRKPAGAAIRWLPVVGAAAAASVLAVVLWPAAIYWHARLSSGSAGSDGPATPVAERAPSATAEPPHPGSATPATPAPAGPSATPAAAGPPAADPLALIQPEPAGIDPAGRREPAERAPRPPGTPGRATVASGGAGGAAEGTAAANGGAGGAAEGTAAVRRWAVAAGERRRAKLGERTQLLLVGPAELEVVSASPDLLEVRLARGAMVGDYRHGPRGRLRILSPGTRTDVVGTTFYVEAQTDGSRVAVGRGRVLVRAGDRRGHFVSAGQLWSSDPPAGSPGIGASDDAASDGPRASASGSNRPSGSVGRARAPSRRSGSALAPLPRDIAVLFAEQAAAGTAPGHGAPGTQIRADGSSGSPWEALAGVPAADRHRPRRAAATGLRAPLASGGGDARPAASGPAGPPIATPPGQASPLEPGERRPAAAPGIGALDPQTPGAPGAGEADSNAARAAAGGVAAGGPAAGGAAAGGAAAGGAAAAGQPAATARETDPASATAGAATAGEQPAASGDGGAAELYRRAERAMGRGEATEARRWLLELAGLSTAGALGPVASYELAQLALRAGDLNEARARLERVRASGASDLAEPAAFLACEVELRAGALEDARRCYRRFRARHPDSVQDAEALGALLRLSPVNTDCGAGRALIDEYLSRHPAGPLAAEAKSRRRACEP